MKNVEGIKVGTKLWAWYNSGISFDIIYYEVLKVGKKKLLVCAENKKDKTSWKYPWYFNGITSEITWLEIFGE